MSLSSSEHLPFRFGSRLERSLAAGDLVTEGWGETRARWREKGRERERETKRERERERDRERERERDGQNNKANTKRDVVRFYVMRTCSWNRVHYIDGQRVHRFKPRDYVNNRPPSGKVLRNFQHA